MTLLLIHIKLNKVLVFFFLSASAAWRNYLSPHDERFELMGNKSRKIGLRITYRDPGPAGSGCLLVPGLIWKDKD